MKHFVFERPSQSLKVYDAGSGAVLFDGVASGDAWGDGAHPPYGHDYPIPPGHYELVGVTPIDPPIASEGAGQIDVADLSDAAKAALLQAHLAAVVSDQMQIRGVTLTRGGLAKYGRAAIMIHGGGSNAPEPLAPHQELCKTEGCTRVYNYDLLNLMRIVRDALNAGEHVVFSAIGDPKPVAR